MARWIALDFGHARTGIAVTDDAAMIASPLETVASSSLWSRLLDLVAERPCAGIVLGDPGQITDSSEGIAALESKIQKQWPSLPLHRVDESFTSSEARASLVAGGMRKKKRQEKGAMDKVAAALILQRFLDGETTSSERPMPDFSSLRPTSQRPKR